MTGPRIIPLSNPSNTRAAHTIVDRAAKAGGWTMVVRKEKRSDAQNRRLWAMLNEIARARPELNGVRMTAEDWKSIFMHALNNEMRVVPALDGQGIVPLGFRSSQLSKQQMSDLQELIAAYAAREEIQLGDEEQENDR